VFHQYLRGRGSDGTLHRHRKLHAFEHSAIRSGDEFTVFDLPEGWRCGLLICYDCNLIENVRITALRGADVLLAPHQTGGVRSRNPHLMGLIDRRLWENRHADPEAIERELRGDKAAAGSCAGCRAARTTTASFSSSAMASASMTMRFAQATR
jgi:hypothetical protein